MADSLPEISVILPVYNGARTIFETVNSVLSQTYKDLELIIVDDGSTDRTREIVSSITDPRIRILFQKQAGVAAARNLGVAAARGRLVAFIDADDLWHPEKLELQQAVLEKNIDVSAVYGWTDYIDGRGLFIFPGAHLSFSGQVYSRLLVNPFLENGSSIMVRKEVFDSIGGFDGAWSPSDDWEWELRLAQKYRFAAISRVLVYYRFSPGSTTSSDLHKFEKNCLDLIDFSFSRAPAEYKHLKNTARKNIRQHLVLRKIELFLYRYPMLKIFLPWWHKLLQNPGLRMTGRMILEKLLSIQPAQFLIWPGKR